MKLLLVLPVLCLIAWFAPSANAGKVEYTIDPAKSSLTMSGDFAGAPLDSQFKCCCQINVEILWATWHDRIDQNYKYPTDSQKMKIARMIPFSKRKDYPIHIRFAKGEKLTYFECGPNLKYFSGGWPAQ
jgi:hypothetical protein